MGPSIWFRFVPAAKPSFRIQQNDSVASNKDVIHRGRLYRLQEVDGRVGHRLESEDAIEYTYREVLEDRVAPRRAGGYTFLPLTGTKSFTLATKEKPAKPAGNSDDHPEWGEYGP
jgi:hypothetical protein